MFRILPLILLTHNIDQNPTCIGPCFGSTCPPKMICYNGECCDEPYSSTTTTQIPTITSSPTTTYIKNKATELPADLKLKLSKLYTFAPLIPSTPYPTTTTQTPFTRQVDNRIRPTCIDLSPTCSVIRHLCFNVIYEVVMIRNCALSCNRCHPLPTVQPSRVTHGECLDYGHNCPTLKPLCSNGLYHKFLYRICKKTCFCS